MKNYPAHTLGFSLRAGYRFFLTVVLAVPLLQACAQNPPRPSRANSFFGIHFDFHARPQDNQIGKTLTTASVNSFLQTVRPDFIQVDTKGNPGLASYPTKVGKAAGIVQDPLKIFRDITAKNGVALYAHYSSLVDINIATTHPEWAAVDAGGKKSGNTVSLFSAYVDNYFIPQLKELSDYGFDGMWIDADNYVVNPDYNPTALKVYSAAKGKNLMRAADINQSDYLQFTRQAYRKYLNHYVSALKKYNPKLQIGSNWAFTARMPGPIDAPVDFLSGDLESNEPSDWTYQVYGMASQGLPWDMMSWVVNTGDIRYKYLLKSPATLEQQAAITLSAGGAYEVYVVQNHDGSLPQDQLLMQTLKEVRDFCYDRKPFCFQATTIPQVALFQSAAGKDRESPHPFENESAGAGFMRMTLDILLDAKYSVQVLNEYTLKGKTGKYPLIVLPQWTYIAPAMVEEFKQYVKNGGRLVAIGPSVSKMLTATLANGVDYNSIPGMSTKSYTYGKGIVYSVVPTMSLNELKQRGGEVKTSIITTLKKVFPTPVVTIDGSDDIHINAATKNGETLISLVNVSKLYAEGGTLPNAIKTTPALNVTLRTNKRPTSIKFQPENTNISFTYANGVAKFTTPGVKIYSIIQVK